MNNPKFSIQYNKPREVPYSFSSTIKGIQLQNITNNETAKLKVINPIAAGS